jgi:hypothetical protein
MAIDPPIRSVVLCRAWRICPCSLLCVTSTSGLDVRASAIVYRGTVQSNNVPFSSHAHDSDRVLRVGVDLGLEDSVDGVGLRAESRRDVVSVSHVFRVINNHHCCFKRHLE